ncbi:hypothetical protein ABPG72_011991 [Tetrahymena utriculariae]
MIQNLTQYDSLNLNEYSNDQTQKKYTSKIQSQYVSSLVFGQPEHCKMIKNKLKIEREEKNSNQSEENFQKDQDFFKYMPSNNIVKNIIKQFLNYLLNEQNESLVSEFIFQKTYDYCKKLIKKYFKDIKYNNQSLIKLVQHRQYGKGLEYFLTFDVYDQLLISKVQNLNQHLQYIEFIKKCCVNRKLLDKINFYKRKCKQQKKQQTE